MGQGPVHTDRIAVLRAVLSVRSLHDFAALLIAHVGSGAVLDDAALAAIRDECVRDIKNSDAIGLSIEEEAEIFGQMVKHVEELLDSAIRKGREGQGRD